MISENKESVCVGIDCETYKGYPILICASTSDYSCGTLIHDDLSILSTDEILNWLIFNVRKPLTGNVMGFFFNISFDVASILKQHFVDVAVSKKTRKEFVDTHRLTCGVNSIHYIPSKAFTIQSGESSHGRYFKCFDISGFTRDGSGSASLNQAAESFLGASKLEGFSDADRAKLNVSLKFWRENTDRIIRYCSQDAYLTACLGQNMIQSIHSEYGFWLNALHSSASIIKAYFSLHHKWLKGQFIRADKCNGWFSPLGLNERQMQLIAHSYYGGMFDTWRFGRIHHVKKRDIVSAYPNIICSLPKLDASQLCSDNEPYHSDALAGFYKINMKYDERFPMPFRYASRVTYPQMDEYTVVADRSIYPDSGDKRIQYITKVSLDYLIKHRAKFKILDSVEFVGDYVPAFPDYRNLFDRRKEYKNMRDRCSKGSVEYRKWNTKQWTAKIAMNSGYGALAEKSHGATQFTHLIYASMITAGCRTQILEAIDRVGFDKVISIATDSIQFSGSNDVYPIGSDLGEWEAVYDDAEIITYQNGIQITREPNRVWEIKARGVPQKNISAKDFLKAKGCTLKYSMLRPVRLLPSLIINKAPHTPANINIFKKMKKTIDLRDNGLKRDVDTYRFEYYNDREVSSIPIDLDTFEFILGEEVRHEFVQMPKLRVYD